MPPSQPMQCSTPCARRVGAAHVLTDGDLSAWEVDWRKRYHGRALAVVRPGSTAEVAAVVRGLRGARHADRAAGRQHRPRRRLGARRERPQVC